MMLESIAGPELWAGFMALLLGILAIDLFSGGRRESASEWRDAVVWSVVWIGVALAFNAWLAARFGAQVGLEFLTGYLIEKALAVDNIFVFLMLFSSLAVPHAQRRRVLFFGIVGALVMRGAFILAGAVLLERFHWLMYLFGGFLLLSGLKLLRERDEKPDPTKNPIHRLFHRLVPSVSEYHGSRFVVRQGGRWLATPLLLVLVCVEVTDLVFAVDSIPAILAVTTDPFLVFSSNAFAILGLRSLFLVLQGSVERLRYLKPGLAGVLTFVGGKMVLSGVYHIPVGWSLGIIVTILMTAILASIRYDRRMQLATRLGLAVNASPYRPTVRSVG